MTSTTGPCLVSFVRRECNRSVAVAAVAAVVEAVEAAVVAAVVTTVKKETISGRIDSCPRAKVVVAAIVAGGGGYNQSQYRIPAGELPKLHKTDNKYVIGTVDDEEEKRQRSFKAILNKLTPDNFEKLLEKLLDVGITEAITLVGLIGQLFEKALQEPTFSSLYAELCRVLSDRFLSEGVEFLDPAAPEGQQAITFKRVLLNKCQEEFESGDKAIAKAEAGDDEDDDKKEGEEGEEGKSPRRRRSSRMVKSMNRQSRRLRRSLRSKSDASN